MEQIIEGQELCQVQESAGVDDLAEFYHRLHGFYLFLLK